MDLNTGRLLWKETFPAPPPYPALDESISCDVLVIGGGEAGALCAWTLSELGLDTVIVEKASIGQGSSAANTGLIQYTNDIPLYQLMRQHGERDAVRFYRLCQSAVERLANITNSVPDPVEFTRRDSLYYASSPRDVEMLEREYKALKMNGFPVDYLTNGEIQELFGFTKSAALLTHGDAEINPYRLTHALVRDGMHKNLRAHENTEVVSLEPSGECPSFTTTQGHRIVSKYAILSVGYEIQETNPLQGAEVACTYAFATEPVADFGTWSSKTLIWETARPYLYMRTTADGRILVGGMDGQVPDGKGRDEPLIDITNKLKAELDQLFPQFSETKIAYRWASSFGNTKDGMPLIGRHRSHPRCFYALGFGGNGTVYYTLAADILSALITKGSHPDERLFAPDRMRWYKAAARQIRHQIARLPQR
jgi:glycine/D-amino acid oxidase-like deaminating enzyme